MLRSIPKKILTHSVTLKIPKTSDRWGAVTYESYELRRVHLQSVHEILKTKDNKEITLRGILFVDSKLSEPKLDWEEIFHNSALVNGQMKIDDYTVYYIDLVPDDEGKLHHVEVGVY